MQEEKGENRRERSGCGGKERRRGGQMGKREEDIRGDETLGKGKRGEEEKERGRRERRKREKEGGDWRKERRGGRQSGGRSGGCDPQDLRRVEYAGAERSRQSSQTTSQISRSCQVDLIVTNGCPSL